MKLINKNITSIKLFRFASNAAGVSALVKDFGEVEVQLEGKVLRSETSDRARDFGQGATFDFFMIFVDCHVCHLVSRGSDVVANK